MKDSEIDALQRHIRMLRRALRKSVPSVGGVSMSAVRVLGAVVRAGDGGGIRPGRIAERLDMASSNVAAGLRELDEAGFVDRRRSEEDARQVEVVLTEKGAAAVAEHRALRVDWLREAVDASLAPAEQEQLSAVIPLLGKLSDAALHGTAALHGGGAGTETAPIENGETR